MQFILLLQEMVSLFLILAIGYYLKKQNILTKDGDQTITNLLLYVTLPLLILHSLDTNFSFEIVLNLVQIFLISFPVLGFSIWIAFVLSKKFSLHESQNAVFQFLIIFGNQGFIGYAICYQLWGQEGVMFASIYNIVYLILIWTYGIYLFVKEKQEGIIKLVFFNPGIIATLLGIIILLTPIKIPLLINEIFNDIGKMTIPLSMILVGSIMANLSLKKWSQYITNVRIWTVTSFRLFLIPLMITPLIFTAIPKKVILISLLISATPCAPTTVMYANKYGGDSEFASFSVFITTILSIFTIPLLYLLF